jgi:hypothetical protein
VLKEKGTGTGKTMEDEIGKKKKHIKQPVLIKQQEQHIGVRSTTYV